MKKRPAQSKRDDEFAIRLSKSLSLGDFARLLGVSTARVHVLAVRGAIPAHWLFGTVPYWTKGMAEAVRPISRRGSIYFVECGQFIKIGFSISISKRMGGLQTSNPNSLSLIHSMPGTMAREAEIHDAFADFRYRGEWFRDAPELRTFIERLQSRGDRVTEAIRMSAGAKE